VLVGQTVAVVVHAVAQLDAARVSGGPARSAVSFIGDPVVVVVVVAGITQTVVITVPLARVVALGAIVFDVNDPVAVAVQQRIARAVFAVAAVLPRSTDAVAACGAHESFHLVAPETALPSIAVVAGAHDELRQRRQPFTTNEGIVFGLQEVAFFDAQSLALAPGGAHERFLALAARTSATIGTALLVGALGSARNANPVHAGIDCQGIGVITHGRVIGFVLAP